MSSTTYPARWHGTRSAQSARPDGAGKTTLFDVLSGVQSVTTGRVIYRGGDISRRTATRRARHGLRRTFHEQRPWRQLPVEDNLRVAVEWRGGGNFASNVIPAAFARTSGP